MTSFSKHIIWKLIDSDIFKIVRKMNKSNFSHSNMLKNWDIFEERNNLVFANTSSFALADTSALTFNTINTAATADLATTTNLDWTRQT